MKAIKQFGLHRTGTNYIQYIIEQNYDVEVLVNKYSHKHRKCRTDRIPEDVNILIIIKHPMSWLVSYFKYWCNKGHRNLKTEANFNKFVFGGFHQKAPDDPIGFWNDSYNDWYELKIDRKVVFIRYEDLLVDHVKLCDKVANELDLDVLHNGVDFVNADNAMNKGGCPTTGKFDTSFYTEKLFLKWFESKTIQYAEERFDKELLKRFGYEVVSGETVKPIDNIRLLTI